MKVKSIGPGICASGQASRPAVSNVGASLVALCLAAAGFGGAVAARAEGIGTMGLPGLVEMPTARMAPDAEISASLTVLPDARRTVLSFQALPWAQASFRYAGIGDEGGYVQSSGYATWDRSFDLRLRLLREGRYLPEVTLGFQDVIGTGIYSGEYLVATKGFGPDLELSAGLGWGRLATASPRIEGGTRPGATGGSFGGEVRTDSFFRGDVGGFGGLSWASPLEGVTLLAELSADDFSREVGFGVSPSDSRLNMGLRYDLGKHASLGAYHIGGQGFAVQIAARINPKAPFPSSLTAGGPRPLSAEATANPASRQEANAPPPNLREDLRTQGVDVTHFSKAPDLCRMQIENRRNVHSGKAVGRSLRAIAMHPDLECAEIEVVLAVDGLQTARLRTTRAQVHLLDQGAAAAEALVAEALLPAEPAPMGAPSLAEWHKFTLRPYLRTSFFDPDKPVYLDTGLRVRGDMRITPKTRLKGAVAQSVAGTFDEMFRGPKGRLPHVRTDFVAYAKGGLTGPRIETLYLEHLEQLSPALFARATAGYLEPMYAGLSSEVLWMPSGLPLALGAEINLVQARAYRQLFETRDLPGLAKANGHLSLYWQTPLEGFEAQIDVGRYLAGDTGATLRLARKFANGWEVGGFATRTSASAADFGEGAYDKGIFVTLPLAAFLPRETRDVRRQVIRSLSGDGGQRLSVEGRLYERLERDRRDALLRNWGTVTR